MILTVFSIIALLQVAKGTKHAFDGQELNQGAFKQHLSSHNNGQQLYNCTAEGYCPPLQWSNCNDTNLTLTLEFIEYAHEPDPLIMGEGDIIIKYAKNVGSKEIVNLMEIVYIYEKLADGTWYNYFNNTFDMCGSDVYAIECPIASGVTLNLTAGHSTPPTPPARSYMAIEHYYDSSYDSPIIGCVVVFWESVSA